MASTSLLACIQGLSTDSATAATLGGNVTTAKAALDAANAALDTANITVTTDDTQLATVLAGAPYNGLALYQDPATQTFSLYTTTPGVGVGFAIQPLVVAN